MEERLIYESAADGFVVTTHTFTRHGAVIFEPSSACHAKMYKSWLFGSPSLMVTGPQCYCDPADLRATRTISSCGQGFARYASNSTKLDIIKGGNDSAGVEFKILDLEQTRSVILALARDLNDAFKKADDYWLSIVAEQQAQRDQKARSLKKL